MTILSSRHCFNLHQDAAVASHAAICRRCWLLRKSSHCSVQPSCLKHEQKSPSSCCWSDAESCGWGTPYAAAGSSNSSIAAAGVGVPHPGSMLKAARLPAAQLRQLECRCSSEHDCLMTVGGRSGRRRCTCTEMDVGLAAAIRVFAPQQPTRLTAPAQRPRPLAAAASAPRFGGRWAAARGIAACSPPPIP